MREIWNISFLSNFFVTHIIIFWTQNRAINVLFWKIQDFIQTLLNQKDIACNNISNVWRL
jgi:hypothetical protein